MQFFVKLQQFWWENIFFDQFDIGSNQFEVAGNQQT
jgi:hypothetical protein